MHLTKPEIDDLKARLDIVEVMGSSGLALRKQGRYLVTRCPFHAGGKERTPSMVVDPDKQLFNCRGGCSLNGDGKAGVHAKSGGDVFTFWEKLTGQSFPQTCEDLAHRFGVSLGGNGRYVSSPGAREPPPLEAPGEEAAAAPGSSRISTYLNAK